MSEPAGITAALVDFRLQIDDEAEVRLIRQTDASALYDLTVRNREHLAPWMTWCDGVIDASDTYAFLRKATREALEHTAFRAGIWRAGTLLGCLDLHEIDWVNGIARIGYWLDAGAMHRGLMTRGVRALTEYAFDALNLQRIEIYVATENAPSRRIPERLGFALEGVLRRAQRVRGRYLDHALYALLRDDDA